MKNISLIAAAIALSVSCYSAAQAAASVQPTASVHYADLDLTKTEGSAQLYRRVTTAAHTVCSSLDPTVSGMRLVLAAPYKACIDNAIAGAVSQVRQPEFAAYVKTRTTTPEATTLTLASR